MKTLFRVFLFLWIFFIPTSLAYHYKKNAGLVNGILVDYRIPTIAADALFLFVLAIVTLVLLAIRQKWQIQFKSNTILMFITQSLLVTYIFQLLLALYQFRFQRSLFGYFPFGEVNFHSTQIVKGTFFNGVLFKLAYGTTVHPNLLAAFCVMSFLLFLLLRKHFPAQRYTLSLLFLSTAFICFLTQSVVATMALISGITTYVLFQQKRQRIVSFIKLATLFLPLASVFLFAQPFALRSTNLSILRRAQLEHIALSMIQAHPIMGIGWNNFTRLQEQYGYVTSTIRFLQPVHNIFLLLITELGIGGWLVCLLIAILLLRVKKEYFFLCTPLVVLGSFDHYLLTLTTGRMIVIFIIAVLFFHAKTKHPPLSKEGCS